MYIMRAGSSFTNFVTDGNVRQNAQTFNPDLFNKVGAITGYPGPSNSIAAAAGDLGGKIVMKGGRSPAPGPSYQSFEESAELRDGTYGKNYAPVKSCNNNQCGGRKMKKDSKKKHTKKKHHKKSTKKHHKKSTKKHHKKSTKKHHKKSTKKHHKKSTKKHHKKSTKKHHKKSTKKHHKKSNKKSRKSLLSLLKFKMRGGEPATVPAGTTSNGYHQYMSNQPQTNVYGLDGNLSPSDNAMANPMKIKVTNACA